MVSDNPLPMLACLFPGTRMTEPIFTMVPLMGRQWVEMECSHSSAAAATKTCGVISTVVRLIVLLTVVVHGAAQIAELAEQAPGLLPGGKILQLLIQYIPGLIMFGKALPEEQVGLNLALFPPEQCL